MEKEVIELAIDVRGSLNKHIQSLQDTITKRNLRIEELEREVEGLKQDPSGLLERLRQQAFQNGYETCSKRLKDRVDELSNVLNLKYF